MTRGIVASAAALALAAVALGSSGSSAVTGWTTFGNALVRGGSTAQSIKLPPEKLWRFKLARRITSQPIVVRGARGSNGATVYVATSAGVVQALSDRGRPIWRVKLGSISHPCKQLDRYGVTGTPVADPSTHALYVADAFGRVHALSLETGKERPGWPVRLFTDFRQELAWGALTLAGGSIYLGTGAFCDAPMVGHVFRVRVKTGAVSHWDVVPADHGGGGGVWGWGGMAYSPTRKSLLAVTGNAFRGGSNDGNSFREWEPYGEHLVELSLGLGVKSANHPHDITAEDDLDFVGSPVIVSRPGCPEQAVALNKNGRLYAWKTKQIAAGPAWTLQLAPSNPAKPLVTQAAYSAPLRALYVATPGGLIKIGITSSCRGRIAWKRKQGVIQSTPTVAGTTVWTVAWHSAAALLAIDGRSGRVVARRALGKDLYLLGPSVLDGRMYLGSFGGLVQALR